MLKMKTGYGLGSLLLGAMLVTGLAGPAFAGNVYAWETEDGTYAFTDDSKRIPAKHRSEARLRSVGQLTRYERYTPVSAERGKPYVERLRERAAELRAVAANASQGVVAGAMSTQGTGIGYTVPVNGGGSTGGRSAASLRVPVDGRNTAQASDEPVVIESRRMQPTDSLATRHWTFVKQGDRIITVIKGERRQRPLKAELQEKDFDF
ncbi:MAG: hypothetical protein AB8G23_16245 [Myxococcota bacterium]